MKAILLRNKIGPETGKRRLSGKPVNNSYEDFGRVLPYCDQFPVSQLTEWRKRKQHKEIYRTLNAYDIIFCEISFYITFQENLDDFLNWISKRGARQSKKIIVYTGAVDRWIRFLGDCPFDKEKDHGKRMKVIAHARRTIKRTFDVMKKVDVIGAMNETDIPFWKGMFPQAHVFWMPCIVPVNAYRKRFKPLEKRDRNRLNLCVHTDLLLPAHAKRGDLMTMAVFRNVLGDGYKITGTTFMQRAHRDAMLETAGLIQKLEAATVKISAHRRDWAEIASKGWLGLNMTFSRVQGRWQTFHAAAGVPMVASEEMTAQKMLFPELSCPWWDLGKAKELTEWVLDMDKNEYLRVAEYAMEKVEWFGPEVQRERLMKVLRGEELEDENIL